MKIVRVALLSSALVASIAGCAARGTDPPRIEYSEQHPPRTHPERNSIRLATINMWGVSVLGFDWADDVDERFAALTRRIGKNDSDLDIVLIQEAWKDSARRDLVEDEDVVSQFPFRIDAVERPGGSGLVLLSAYPIEEARFLRFESQGNCWKFWEGDCIGGKGVLAARVRRGEEIIWVANTHLIACYSASLDPGESCDRMDDNGEDRRAQVAELRAFLEALSTEAPVLVGGDFNFTRASHYYRAMSSPRGPTRRDLVRTGTSRGSVLEWKERPERDPTTDRIDYIWSLGTDGRRWHSPAPTEKIMAESVELISGKSVPLSDHPALVSEFCLLDSNERDAADPCLSLSAGSTRRAREASSSSGASPHATDEPD